MGITFSRYPKALRFALSWPQALAKSAADVFHHRARFSARSPLAAAARLVVALGLVFFCPMSLATDMAAGFPGKTDAELMQQMASGDASALGVFYDRHSTLLFSIAYKVTGDMQEAEEAMQDGLRQLWERATAYDASLGLPLSWAVVIVRHKAIDRLRALKRRSDGLERLTQSALTDLPADPQASAAAHPCAETVTRLHGALRSLPREQSAAIELAFLQGLSHSEIATRLGAPLGTIKARIRRGMITLRDALEDQL